MLAGNQRTEFLCQHIQRDDGERVSVEGGEHRHRQVDMEQHGHDRRAYHLKRAGNQAAEHADGNPARHRAAMQMPQIVMMQPRAKRPQPAVLLDAFVVR